MGLIAAMVCAAYSNSFRVPELFDDDASISQNPSLRSFASALHPPSYATVGGRPVLNLSLALSRAISPHSLWGFHLLNLLVHVGSACLLFAVVARTMSGRPSSGRAVALVAALLWALHPMQTESVTYLVQRAESLMGLFYLTALYAFIRSAAAKGAAARWWAAASALACLLGMGTKEVMVSAPLVILLYDRTFVAGSIRGAWSRRRGYYCALAATWLVLPPLVASTHGRGGTAGFGSGIAWWPYLAAQGGAIARYLKLSIWPAPLVFDYGTALPHVDARLVACGLGIAALFAASAWACRSRPALGFLGICFFAVLAPTSSFVPISSEPVAEHRMYLALAPIAVLAALGIRRGMGRAWAAAGIALAAVLGTASYARNRDYHSAEALWRDTATKRPTSARAHSNLGVALGDLGRGPEAMAEFEKALLLDPGSAEAHVNLGNSYAKTPGRGADALEQFQEAVRLKPDFEPARKNLGDALLDAGLAGEAARQEQEAVRIRPGDAAAHADLCAALAALPGRVAESEEQGAEAVALDPSLPQAHACLAAALANEPGKLDEAEAQAREAVGLDARDARAHDVLGQVLVKSRGRASEAEGEFREAVRLDPALAGAHNNLGNVLVSEGRAPEALPELRESVRLQPRSAQAHNNLGVAIASGGGGPGEAIEEYRRALEINPAYVSAHSNLGSALASQGRMDAATIEFREAARLSPDNPAVRLNLALALLRGSRSSAEAASELREVLRLQPGNQTARQILARIGDQGH
jgi:tetratricopeptide (TPR) repeat protein